jgi:chemotaxis signal transduction protein
MAAVSPALAERRETRRACVFTLAGRPFAVDVHAVREVVVFADYTPVPRTLPHVIGVGNLRGDIVPIVDIQPLLGLPAWRPGSGLRTLVIAPPPFLVALPIEEVVALEQIDDVAPLGEARHRHGPWTLGLLRLEGRWVPLLDVVKLLGALRS